MSQSAPGVAVAVAVAVVAVAVAVAVVAVAVVVAVATSQAGTVDADAVVVRLKTSPWLRIVWILLKNTPNEVSFWNSRFRGTPGSVASSTIASENTSLAETD